MLRKTVRQHMFYGFIGIAFFGLSATGYSTDFQCPPTPGDMMGPFYKPGAPMSDSVGKGYILQGTVKSAADCSAIKDA